MNERSRKRFRCKGHLFPKGSWSVGVGITHSWGETYIWVYVGLGAVMIGFMEDW